MKLRNKETGEIDDFIFEVITDRIDLYRRVGHSDTKNIWHYNSLAELNEEWEDYEEPKEHWCITMYGGITRIKDDEEPIDDLKETGNYFNDKESAYEALEKLKVWKRMKDKGAEIVNYECYGGTNTKGEFSGEVVVTISVPQEVDKYLFMLLFGGEE